MSPLNAKKKKKKKAFKGKKLPSMLGQDSRCSKNEVLWFCADKTFWQAHACTEECLGQGRTHGHLPSLSWIAFCQPDAL